MRRRTLLGAVGASITVPIVGCTEEEAESAEGSVGDGDENGNAENGNDGSSDESSSNNSGGGLEIVNHEFYTEDFQAGVRGKVANNTGDTLDYVEVKVWFYDEEGTQIGDSLDNTESLDDGTEWAFDAMFLGDDPETVADYEIEVSDSPF